MPASPPVPVGTSLPFSLLFSRLTSSPVPCRNSYLFKYFSHALRALQTSLKTSIRLDERGLISLQCLMPRGTGATGTGAQGNAAKDHGFIEFAVSWSWGWREDDIIEVSG